MNHYLTSTPSLKYVISKYWASKTPIFDHIAHRGLSRGAISQIAEYYQHNGFKIQADVYKFPKLNVEAKWLHKPNFIIPRIFVSEYQGEVQSPPRSGREYLQLNLHNQYLAWTLIHGGAINHLALSTPNIKELYQKLREDPNVTIATQIQESQDGNLLQFSLQADKIKHIFPNGETMMIPGYFIEFIERLNGREGFEGDNAEKIFESTK